jgi:hypothetical protein
MMQMMVNNGIWRYEYHFWWKTMGWNVLKIVDLFGGFGGNLHFKKPPKWDNNLQTRMIFHQDLIDPPKAKMIKMNNKRMWLLMSKSTWQINVLAGGLMIWLDALFMLPGVPLMHWFWSSVLFSHNHFCNIYISRQSGRTDYYQSLGHWSFQKLTWIIPCEALLTQSLRIPTWERHSKNASPMALNSASTRLWSWMGKLWNRGRRWDF